MLAALNPYRPRHIFIRNVPRYPHSRSPKETFCRAKCVSNINNPVVCYVDWVFAQLKNSVNHNSNDFGYREQSTRSRGSNGWLSDSTCHKRPVTTQNVQNERTRDLISGLIQHLHDYVREVKLKSGEWETGVQYLTKVKQMKIPYTIQLNSMSHFLGNATLCRWDKHAPRTGRRWSCSQTSWGYQRWLIY